MLELNCSDGCTDTHKKIRRLKVLVNLNSKITIMFFFDNVQNIFDFHQALYCSTPKRGLIINLISHNNKMHGMHKMHTQMHGKRRRQ